MDLNMATMPPLMQGFAKKCSMQRAKMIDSYLKKGNTVVTEAGYVPWPEKGAGKKQYGKQALPPDVNPLGDTVIYAAVWQSWVGSRFVTDSLICDTWDEAIAAVDKHRNSMPGVE